jgi:multisubunit Na+/H+ antiporter MnhG subunit
MTKIRIAVTSIALSAPLWLAAIADASYGKGVAN